MHRQLEAISQKRSHHQEHLLPWRVPFGMRFDAVAVRVYPVRRPNHPLAPGTERNLIGYPDQNPRRHAGRYDASPGLKLNRLTRTGGRLHRYGVEGWQWHSSQHAEQDTLCNSRCPDRRDSRDGNENRRNRHSVTLLNGHEAKGTGSGARLRDELQL